MSESGEAKSYLVECYWPGVSEEKLALASQRARRAAYGLRRHGRELRFRGSILVPADETVFCLFDGEATFDYRFSASDVSTLDYFHPSLRGQAKVASLTWKTSWWGG